MDGGLVEDPVDAAADAKELPLRLDVHVAGTPADGLLDQVADLPDDRVLVATRGLRGGLRTRTELHLASLGHPGALALDPGRLVGALDEVVDLPHDREAGVDVAVHPQAYLVDDGQVARVSHEQGDRAVDDEEGEHTVTARQLLREGLVDLGGRLVGPRVDEGHVLFQGDAGGDPLLEGQPGADEDRLQRALLRPSRRERRPAGGPRPRPPRPPGAAPRSGRRRPSGLHSWGAGAGTPPRGPRRPRAARAGRARRAGPGSRSSGSCR